MAGATELIFSDGGGPAPFRVTLAADQEIELESVTAEWNGAGAAGSFLACLSLYSQSGILLSRTFPRTTLAPGDSGVVTYAPFLGAADSALDLSVVGAAVTRDNLNPQSIASGFAWVVVNMDAETFDTASMWTAAAPSRLTVTRAGLYLVTGAISLAANAAGGRGVGILKNGGGQALVQMQGGPGGAFVWGGAVTTVIDMEVGDHLELACFQSSGVALDTGDCSFSALGFGQL